MFEKIINFLILTEIYFICEARDKIIYFLVKLRVISAFSSRKQSTSHPCRRWPYLFPSYDSTLNTIRVKCKIYTLSIYRFQFSSWEVK